MFWAFVYVVSVFGYYAFAELEAGTDYYDDCALYCSAYCIFPEQDSPLEPESAEKFNSQITNAYNEGITGVRTSKSMVVEEDNQNNFFKITKKDASGCHTFGKVKCNLYSYDFAF